MTFNAYQLPPPADWQNFERLAHALFSAVWNDPRAQLHGRAGQAQGGVDVYGTNSTTGGLEGVQCKGKDGRFGHSVDTDELEAEVAKALTFTPALSHYYLVTTGPADAAVQQAARDITAAHKTGGKFGVTVFAWEQLVSLLEQHKRVARQYFRALHVALAEIHSPAELIAICHQSFQHRHGLFDRVDPVAAAEGFVPILMDSSPHYDGAGVLDVRAAIGGQRHLFRNISEALRTRPQATVAYFGIAHVPLVMHAGTAASTKTGVRLYEFEATTGDWVALLDQHAPDLGTELVDEGGPPQSADAVIRVEVSARVNAQEIQQTLSRPCRQFAVRVREPRRGIITHEEQVSGIAHAFREALDKIHNENPQARRHVFAAVPVSVAFRLGQMVSHTMHKSVLAYNYSQRSEPPYHWALDLVAGDDDPKQLWVWEGNKNV
jgi:hypothetical protein